MLAVPRPLWLLDEPSVGLDVEVPALLNLPSFKSFAKFVTHCNCCLALHCCYCSRLICACPKLQPETCDYMKSKDTSLFMLSLLMQRVEELVDQGVEILEELIAQHQHQGGIVLVATHVPINLPDALALRLPPR
jgi:hypothetical protein